MSTKVEISLAADAMKQAGIPAGKIREVIEALNAEAAAKEKDADEKPPAAKKQFVIVLSDPRGRLTKEFFDAAGFDSFVGWVIQIEESESPHTAIEKVEESAYIFNRTKRGRLMPLQTIGETFESCPSFALKEAGVWVKTKMPVQVVITKNEIDGTPGILPGQSSGDENLSRTIRTKHGSVTIDARGLHCETKKAQAEVEAIFKKHGVEYTKEAAQ